MAVRWAKGRCFGAPEGSPGAGEMCGWGGPLETLHGMGFGGVSVDLREAVIPSCGCGAGRAAGGCEAGGTLMVTHSGTNTGGNGVGWRGACGPAGLPLDTLGRSLQAGFVSGPVLLAVSQPLCASPLLYHGDNQSASASLAGACRSAKFTHVSFQDGPGSW